MTTEQQQQDATPAIAGKDAQEKINARRKFLRAGSTGVVLTLASGSGMATVCTVPSMTMSGPTMASRGVKIARCGGGNSPGHWKKPSRHWPLGTSRNTPFGDVFPSVDPYACTKMGVMIKQQDPANYFDTHNLGCHFTATYLNIKQGLVKFMTVDQLVAIWNELQTFGVYAAVDDPKVEPWSKERVAKYLESTYHD